jgi:flagellar biogenesis protein FliO
MRVIRLLALGLTLFSSFLSASQLASVKVSGEKQADVLFVFGSGEPSVPTIKVTDNIVELTFLNTDLEESLQSKLDLSSPHSLIQRIATFSSGKDVVRSRIVVNGSSEGLRARLGLHKENGAVRLSLEYPKGAGPALSLWKEEQEPISVEGKATKEISGRSMTVQIALLVLVLILTGGAAFFFLRFVKKQGGLRGSRKFLIEQLSYCPLGQKAGVSLLKIGREFVLVGITPNQVSLLSDLPRLREQYEEEATLERGAFKSAVEEEFKRIKGTFPR